MASLITLEEFQEIKGVGRSNADTRISALLEPVSSLVRHYCNREFTTYVSEDAEEEIYIYWEQPFVLVQEIPLISISGIEVDGVALASSDFTCINRTGQVRLKDKDWTAGSSVCITYRGGYTSTPEDIKLAVVDLVNYYFKEEYRENKAFQSVSLETPGSTTVRNDDSFPDHIKRVLDLYKLEDLSG